MYKLKVHRRSEKRSSVFKNHIFISEYKVEFDNVESLDELLF